MLRNNLFGALLFLKNKKADPYGAGNGNRTRTVGLGSRDSTTKLCLQIQDLLINYDIFFLKNQVLFFILARNLLMMSNGIIENETKTANNISTGCKGTVLKSSPPKYMIRIWINEIKTIIIKNNLFFLMFEKIQTLSLLAIKQLNIPKKMNIA